MTDKEYELYKSVIARYRANHAGEWNAFLESQRIRKKEMSDKQFGTTESGDGFRLAGSVPKQLDLQLKMASMKLVHKPDYLNRNFLESFPVFKMVEKL